MLDGQSPTQANNKPRQSTRVSRTIAAQVYADDFGLENLAQGEDIGKRGAGEDAGIEIDPHISAAPVFFGVDESGQEKRMVVPVSYFATRRK